jgi:hypothetical protein
VIAALLLSLVSVAVESPRKEYWLGEPVPVRVRIEIDGKFLRENALPLTLRRTDVPVLLEASWLKGLPAGPGDATLAVNDDVVAALRSEAGGSTVLVIERTLRPEKAGDLELAAPVLRFASATRFDEDALGTRVALDRIESSVKGEPLTIRILPLPAEGQPAGFSGGVGKFTITATADATEVEAGQSLHLILTVTGEGDLAAIAPPRLDGLAGFHVFGRLDGGDAAKRTFTYELAPLDAGVTTIPPIALDFFDPAPPAGYRVARTEAIPLRVRPGAPSSAPPRPPGRSCFTGEGAVAAGIIFLILGALAVWFLRRRGIR